MLACPLFTASAFAQNGGQNQALAESLFQQARDLMESGQYEKACPKLAESQRLDPAGGTLLRLALCYEKQGRTATAWVEYTNGLALARREGRQDRVTFAQEAIARLEPTLARLRVDVSPEAASIDGFRLERDGVPLGRPAWGVATPVDPGEHVLRATASGYEPTVVEIQVEPAAGTTRVVIPMLKKMGDVEPAGPVAPSGRQVEAEPSEKASNRTLAYVAGGVGLVGLGVGSYFGLRAMSKRADAEEACPGSPCSDKAGVDANDAAKTSANISNIGLGVGVLGVGAAVVLWLTDPGARESGADQAGIRLAPEVGGTHAGVRMGGRW